MRRCATSSTSTRTPEFSASRARGVAALALSAAASACNLGEREVEPTMGPRPIIVAVTPTPGEGVGCGADPLCGVPINAVVQLRFDRYLQPSTATRQSVRLYAGNPEQQEFLQPDYDLVERVLALTPLKPLKPDTVYTLELLSPADEEDETKAEDAPGFRAFDGAPLGAGPVPSVFVFKTRAAPAPGPLPPSPPTPDCRAALALFREGCAERGCHSPATCDAGLCSYPAMNLDLATVAGLEAAIRVTARETARAPSATAAANTEPRFGLAMPVLEPGRAANSYLLYKVVANPESYVTGSGAPAPSVWQVPAPAGIAPPPAELERLHDWFLELDAMPQPGAHVTADDMRLLQAWLGAGAPTRPCE